MARWSVEPASIRSHLQQLGNIRKPSLVLGPWSLVVGRNCCSTLETEDSVSLCWRSLWGAPFIDDVNRMDFAKDQRPRTKDASPQPLFQLHALIGLLVAIFHDDRSVERNAPFGRVAFLYCSRTRHDDCALWDFKRSVLARPVHLALHQIVERGRPRQDCSCPKHRACAHQSSLVHTAIAAHE